LILKGKGGEKMTPEKSKVRLAGLARKMEARIKKSDLKWKRRERAGKAAKA
jgi:hypothetical protein